MGFGFGSLLAHIEYNFRKKEVLVVVASNVDLRHPRVGVVRGARAHGAVAAGAHHAVGVGAAVRERRVGVVAGVPARQRRGGLAGRAARALAAHRLLGALGHAQLVEALGVLLLVPFLAHGVDVRDVGVLVLDAGVLRLVARVVVGDRGKVDRRLQRAVVEAVLQVRAAVGARNRLAHRGVVVRVAVAVGDVGGLVAKARHGVAAVVAVGGRAHALLGDVRDARGPARNAGAVLERVVRRAVGVVVARVVHAARNLDRGAVLEPLAVLVLVVRVRVAGEDRAIVVFVATAQGKAVACMGP